MDALDPIDVADPREYAWLLERSDTFTGSLVEVWKSVPVAPGSWGGRLVGYPLRFLLLAATVGVVATLVLAMVVVAGVTPVTLFTLAEPMLPGTVWLVLLGGAGAILVGYLMIALTVHLQRAARGDEALADMSPFLTDGVVAGPPADGSGWNPDDSLHVSHERARRRLFATLILMIGVVLQFTAVVLGEAWFAGPVESAMSWALFFARSLFDTALLGIPAALVPPWSALEPAGRAGDLLMVGVDLCFAAGLLALMASSLASTLTLGELFNGSTRDLADYLEDSDVSSGDALTIHRVAVVRPLDPDGVVSLTKAEFFERVRGEPPGPPGVRPAIP